MRARARACVCVCVRESELVSLSVCASRDRSRANRVECLHRVDVNVWSDVADFCDSIMVVSNCRRLHFNQGGAFVDTVRWNPKDLLIDHWRHQNCAH